jgi:hypothetical protein
MSSNITANGTVGQDNNSTLAEDVTTNVHIHLAEISIKESHTLQNSFGKGKSCSYDI